jgi:hypothetical protein
MIGIRDRREGHEELNLDVDGSLDTPVYRDAYRELIKSSSTSKVTYEQFLCRMKQRNIASRKKEFERRAMSFDSERNPRLAQIFRETKAALAAITAGNPA